MIFAIDRKATGGAGTVPRLTLLASAITADPKVSLPARRSQWSADYSKRMRLAGVGGIGLTMTPARPANLAISVSSLCE